MLESRRTHYEKKTSSYCGPTCSGKSKYAESVARQFRLESINLDSFQLYSFFQLGTGRSDNIPYGHLYGVVDPREEVSEESYLKMVEQVIESVLSRGSLPLYLKVDP
jgi:tRNA dimethylallyltransferase